jgi:transcriptional regulator with XRE-family HTH domain
MKLSTKLREHMERLGMSQDTLAEHLGVSQALVSKWKRGRGMPKTPEVRAMADLFGVSCDYLLNDELPVMSAEETEYDREVRKIARKVGPKQVWEILMGSLGGASPAAAPPVNRIQTSPGGTPPKAGGSGRGAAGSGGGRDFG